MMELWKEPDITLCYTKSYGFAFRNLWTVIELKKKTTHHQQKPCGFNYI